MAKWSPNICNGGQCILEWEIGSNWDPLIIPQKWDFLSVCQEHAKYLDKDTRLQTLKLENQSMSYGRAKLAEIIDLKFQDGEKQGQADSAGSQIDFIFDNNRNISFKVPISYEQIVMNKKLEIQSEFIKINPNLKI